MRFPILYVLLMLLPAVVQATCWQQAGERYGIEPALLQAIASAESNLNADAIHRNQNGSFDIGLMQINSQHLPVLQQYGISEKKLLQDPCLSVITGAWILAGFIRQHGYNWKAVGAYNAGSSPGRKLLRQKYIQRVLTHYLELKSETAKKAP